MVLLVDAGAILSTGILEQILLKRKPFLLVMYQNEDMSCFFIMSLRIKFGFPLTAYKINCLLQTAHDVDSAIVF